MSGFEGFYENGHPTVHGLHDTRNLWLPTTRNLVSGIILKNNQPWFHNFNPPATNGGNIFLGFGAGNFTMATSGPTYEAARNIGIGDSVLTHLTTGYFNVGIGWQANHACTTGAGNMSIGGNANPACTTGFDNVAIGDDALWHNVTSSCNTAVGHLAGQTLTASGVPGPTTGRNTFIGYNADCSAGISATLVNSIAIGGSALVTASNQCVIGNASITNNVMYGDLSVPTLTATTSISTVTGTFTGTINANYVGANMRIKADGTTPNDGFVGASGTGIIYFGNWDLNRGWKINADGTMGSLGSGFVGFGTTSPDRIAHAEAVNATTNAVTYGLRLTHTVSGAGVGAAGLGTGIEFELETATNTTMKVAGTHECAWTTATAGTEDSYQTFSVVAGGILFEAMRISKSGYIGIKNTNPTQTIHAIESGVSCWLLEDTYSDTLCSAVQGRRARNTSASPVATSSGDCLFDVKGSGYYTAGGSPAFTTRIVGMAYYAAENTTNTGWGTYISFTTTPTTSITAREIVRLNDDGSLEVWEVTAPGFATTNGAKIFAVVSGVKTVLKVQFQSGAAQTLATEP